MDENLKIDKKDITPVNVKIVNEKEEKKDYVDAPEYYENKIAKEDIDDIEVE